MYLRQLFSNVSTHKYSLQVDPEVLDSHPVLYYIRCVGKILNPLLNLGFKWGVVSGRGIISTWKMKKYCHLVKFKATSTVIPVAQKGAQDH